MPIRISRVVQPTPAWRSALWRWRHAFLAVALLAALLAVIEALAPAPPGTALVALRSDVPAGEQIPAAALVLAVVPDDAAPDRSFVAPAEVVGRRPVVGLPAGTVLSDDLLLGPGLAVPAGHVALPVSVADPGSLALARSGTNVTLVSGPPDSGGEGIWVDVRVLSVLESAGDSSLLGGDPPTAVLLVAVPARLARVVVEASAAVPLRVALPAR